MDMFNFNLNRLVRENVAKLKPYSSARDEFQGDSDAMVFLDANENPFETIVNRYPDPQQRSLKQLVSEQKKVRESQLLIGNGSDEILDLLFRAFCEPTIDNIITLPPTYGMYRVLAGINDIENREVFLTNAFEPDVDEILKVQNDRSKLLFLCSPNNPTGNIFSEDKINQLLEGFNGLVIIDEAYIDFASIDSWITKLQQFPNLVVTQTLSKAYGMAGIRLGMCFASEEIIAVLNKIKPPYNVNELTQQHAVTRLQKLEEVADEVSKILSERLRLETLLESLSFVTKVYRSDANFLLVQVDDANRRYKQLIDNYIVVRNRSNQPKCANTLRITVGTSKENDQLINILNSLNS